MINLCSNGKYEFFNKGDIIYKIGEQAEKFFILLNGEAINYKPKRKLVKMTKKEYVLLLKKIKDSNDPYLLKKTILINKETMDINEYEIPRLIEKLSRIHLIRLDLERKKYFMIRLEGKYTKAFESFIEEIDAGIITSDCTPEDIKAKLYHMTGLTESDKEEDEIIFNEEKYEVSVFNYEENGVFANADYFGENGNNAIDRKRTQFIVAKVDMQCMSISNDIYQKNILAEFQKLKNKEISFLNDNCIFKNIQKGTFLNHYFKYFTIEEYWRGENIFIEMQKTEKIYFIKEGRIELNLYTNIMKMHNYAKELMNINSEITNHFKNEEKLPQLNFQPKDYMEILKKKKFVSLFLFQDNDMLGIEEAFYGFKRLYRATVCSDRAFLYSIPINKFKKMVEFEPKIIEDFKSYSFMKICNLIQRLSNIKNDRLKFIDGNYKEDNTQKNFNYESVNREKNEKKASSEITIINQVNLNTKLTSQSEVNLLIQTDKNKYKAKKNKKEKVKSKKIKKSQESIVDELARYYQDYQNWNKHLNKKLDLMLNPQINEFQFYKQINYELNTIKDLKCDIDKIRNNSIANILPKIRGSYKLSKLNSLSRRIETTSDNENSNNSNMKGKENKIEEFINIEENDNCESSDDSLPIIQRKPKVKTSNNRHSIHGTKLYKEKISTKNLNQTINESGELIINNNENNNNNNSNPNISIKINPNAYTTRFSSSILNKNKRTNTSQSNLFMTNVAAKNNNDPLANLNNEKNLALEHQLNISIEMINYNHGNISSRSFRDAEIRGTISSERNKAMNDKSPLRFSKAKTTVNSRINTKFNSIDEESIKATASYDNININNTEENKDNNSHSKSKNKINNNNNENNKVNKFQEKPENPEIKKDLINYNFFNIRRIETTEESSEDNSKNQKDQFGCTKLILSQSLNLKTNKLKRLHREHMPRYYSNKFSANTFIEQLDDLNENKKEEEEKFSPQRQFKKQGTYDPIENLILKKSSCFVPFSVDNSVNGIKKLNKRIQMLAPKKKYNFIINNY